MTTMVARRGSTFWLPVVSVAVASASAVLSVVALADDDVTPVTRDVAVERGGVLAGEPGDVFTVEPMWTPVCGTKARGVWAC
jgi:hypothetical protein